ncbi:MAG TPA: hypothetical protein ENM97_03100, partial [Moorella mulderi]|nr:hypothetical protein [Moorella mulderi]
MEGQFQGEFIATLFLIFAAVLLSNWAALNQLSQPLQKITGQLQWGWEELESEFPEDTPGEWGLLASHLNRLVRTLRH